MATSDEEQFDGELAAPATGIGEASQSEVSASDADRGGGAGGAAMAGGQRFQAQVTAWWSARVLLQTHIGEPYGLPALSVAQGIYCETRDSIDDIRVDLTSGDKIFGQCKKGLDLSTSEGSEWASVLTQFYGELDQPSSSVAQKRFVLFYERHNGNLEKMKTVLDRYRPLPVGTPIIDAAMNKDERGIVNNLNLLLDTLQSKSAVPHLAARREELLRHTYIKQLRLESGEPDYLHVADALQDGLLTNPSQTTQMLNSLHRLADDLLAERGSTDRSGLRARLQGEGIALRDSVDFRPDFEKLANWSNTELATHQAEGRTKLVIGSDVISINRPVVGAMVAAALRGSYVVAGSAGTGKTGCLVDLALRLRSDGLRVWYWAADSLPAPSVQEMATHLHLEHAWAGVLAEAATGTKTVIIVDGLDGLRDTRAQQAYRKLFALAIQRGIVVIASIRSFDLQYAIELEQLFARADLGIPQEFTNPALQRFSHISVPELGTQEFLQILTQLPQVLSVLRNAPQLLPVVLNLFSLDLLCKLISDGELVEELSSVSTQAELFERYWAKRITAHALREEMASAIGRLIEQMTASRTLQVICEAWPGEVKTALFSAEIVRYPTSAPGRLPQDRLVEFNHHLLFDYAAELLFVRPRRKRIPQKLAAPDTWGLFLRPSLLLFHRYVWKNGRLDFWETMIALEEGAVPMLHKLPGYMAVAEAASNLQDLQPLIDGSLSGETVSQFWLQILRGIISAASFMSLPGLFNEGRGDFWLQFAHELVNSGNQDLINEGQWLLSSAARFARRLSANGQLIFNQTAIILRHHYTRAGMQASHILRFAIDWICVSADVNRDDSIAALREAITTDQLHRFGYIQAYAVAHQIDKIWALGPELAVEVYDAIFGYVETETTQVRLDNSLILGFTAEKKQEYGMARHLLTWKFGDFMSALPYGATRAMVKVLRHYRDQEHPRVAGAEIKKFTWSGRECRFLPDHSSSWDVHDYDEPQKIANTWRRHVSSLVSADDAAAQWDGICDVLVTESEMAAIWRKLLFAAASAPEFYSPRLWTMLIEPVILAEDDTQDAVKDCIVSFSSYLGDTELNEIQTAVLALNRQHIPYDDDDYANRRLSYLKIKFLLAITEERRSPAAKDFLSACDPELLGLFKRRSAEAVGDYEPTAFEQFEEATTEAKANPRERELLQVSAPLMHVVAKEITNDRLPGVLQDLQDAERLLDESRSGTSNEIVAQVESRLLRGFSVIASSDASQSDELTEALFGRFQAVLDTRGRPEVDSVNPFDPYLLAAKGVLGLSRRVNNLPSGSREVLTELANHDDPSVRLLFAEKIWTLFELLPEVVWETLEGWVQELPVQSGSVSALRAALRDNWFWFLRNHNSERADRLLHALWVSAHAQGNRELRLHSSEWLTALWIVKQEESARDVLGEAITSQIDYLKELWGIVQFSSYGLFPSQNEKEFLTVAQKLMLSELLVEVLGSAKRAVDSYFLQFEKTDQSQTPADHPEWVLAPGRMFSQISGRIRFTAEELAARLANISGGDMEREMSSWWSYTEPILDVLLSIPHPSFAFNLVEGLERLIRFDFKKTLHWISRATTASAPAGFAGESLAQSRVIGILERTLADHRVSLADDVELRTDFLQTLEAFLAVGDPRAMSLAIQLDSIFR